uniref:Uncharacterized protein n=1 Tax=Desertifilum tharense IPPAS B-1220 TaxID=1781255 RepID=A0ACD5GVG6_9CYAN
MGKKRSENLITINSALCFAEANATALFSHLFPTQNSELCTFPPTSPPPHPPTLFPTRNTATRKQATELGTLHSFPPPSFPLSTQHFTLST